MSTRFETRTAPVVLSSFHGGQMIEHGSEIEAEGHYYCDGRDAFGKPMYRWTADRYRARCYTWDRSLGHRDEHELVETSQWYSTWDDAEQWLTDRGLRICCTGRLKAPR